MSESHGRKTPSGRGGKENTVSPDRYQALLSNASYYLHVHITFYQILYVAPAAGSWKVQRPHDFLRDDIELLPDSSCNIQCYNLHDKELLCCRAPDLQPVLTNTIKSDGTYVPFSYFVCSQNVPRIHTLQQSESIEAALDMELRRFDEPFCYWSVPSLVESRNILSRFGSLLV